MATSTYEPHPVRPAAGITDLLDRHVASLYGLSASLHEWGAGFPSSRRAADEVDHAIAVATRLRTRLA